MFSALICPKTLVMRFLTIQVLNDASFMMRLWSDLLPVMRSTRMSSKCWLWTRPKFERVLASADWRIFFCWNRTFSTRQACAQVRSVAAGRTFRPLLLVNFLRLVGKIKQNGLLLSCTHTVQALQGSATARMPENRFSTYMVV